MWADRVLRQISCLQSGCAASASAGSNSLLGSCFDGLVYWLGLWPDNGLASCSARRGAFLISIGPQLNLLLPMRGAQSMPSCFGTPAFSSHTTLVPVAATRRFCPCAWILIVHKVPTSCSLFAGRLTCIMMDSVPCGALLSCCTVASTMATDGGGHGQVRSGRRSLA